MIKVSNEMTIYEIDGKEVGGLLAVENTLTVRSHWNRNALVVLEYGGRRLAVSADDLQRAIRNATNTKF